MTNSDMAATLSDLLTRVREVADRDDMPVYVRDSAEDLAEAISETLVALTPIPNYVPEGMAP